MKKEPQWKTQHLWWDDALHAALQVALKHVSLGQLLVPVGRKPDFGQRPTFAEYKVGVKHGLDVLSAQGEGEGGSGVRPGGKQSSEEFFKAVS